jgi:hypothetical protein
MNMQELIELLEDCDPEAEVRLAHQPGWPLAFELRGVAAPTTRGTRATRRPRRSRAWSGSLRAATPTTRRTRASDLWDIARVA